MELYHSKYEKNMALIGDSKKMENLSITSMKKKIVKTIANNIRTLMKDGILVRQMKKLYH
jgi:hypothetical protein